MTREEAIAMIEDDKKRHHDELSGRYRAALTMAIEALEQEPKRGEWVNARDGVSDHVKCTNCFRTYYLGIVENYNFCPNCGAQMKGADDE